VTRRIVPDDLREIIADDLPSMIHDHTAT